MATTPFEAAMIEYDGITIEMYSGNSDTLVHSFTVTQRSNNKATQYGNIVDISSGAYRIRGKITATNATVYQDWLDHVNVAVVEYPRSEVGCYNRGTGARTVLITVTDGTDPLENATVRLAIGNYSVSGQTDVNGQIAFYLDDSTYSVIVTKSFYSSVSTTLLVDGNKSPTYELTASVFPSPTENTVPGVAIVYDGAGDPEDDVSVYVQMIIPPPSSGGYDSEVKEYISAGGGIVTIDKLFIDAEYDIWRKGGNKVRFIVPELEDDEDYIELPPIIGDDSEDPCS